MEFGQSWPGIGQICPNFGQIRPNAPPNRPKLPDVDRSCPDFGQSWGTSGGGTIIILARSESNVLQRLRAGQGRGRSCCIVRPGFDQIWLSLGQSWATSGGGTSIIPQRSLTNVVYSEECVWALPRGMVNRIVEGSSNTCCRTLSLDRRPNITPAFGALLLAKFRGSSLIVGHMPQHYSSLWGALAGQVSRVQPCRDLRIRRGFPVSYAAGRRNVHR